MDITQKIEELQNKIAVDENEIEKLGIQIFNLKNQIKESARNIKKLIKLAEKAEEIGK